jgi:drug/metabolite transporter (DMT)-like permease
MALAAGFGRARLPPLVLACLAATWLIWGSTYLAIKFALVSFPPYLQMGSRFLVAGLGLAAWMRWARGVPWPDRTQWRNALIVGALMLAGGMGNVAVAEQTVGSGLVVVFIAIVPLLIVLVNLCWGVRPGRLELAGIGLGLAGVVMLTRGQGFQASPVGLAAVATACTCWSLGSVLSQRALPLAPGAMGFASEMLAGGIVLTLLALATGESFDWPPDPLAAWAWVYLVIFGSLLAFNAYMVLLAETSAGLAASYTFVNPIIALALGIALGNETVTAFEWLAAGVILAGVVLLLVQRPAEAAAKEREIGRPQAFRR